MGDKNTSGSQEAKHAYDAYAGKVRASFLMKKNGLSFSADEEILAQCDTQRQALIKHIVADGFSRDDAGKMVDEMTVAIINDVTAEVISHKQVTIPKQEPVKGSKYSVEWTPGELGEDPEFDEKPTFGSKFAQSMALYTNTGDHTVERASGQAMTGSLLIQIFNPKLAGAFTRGGFMGLIATSIAVPAVGSYAASKHKEEELTKREEDKLSALFNTLKASTNPEDQKLVADVTAVAHKKYFDAYGTSDRFLYGDDLRHIVTRHENTVNSLQVLDNHGNKDKSVDVNELRTELQRFLVEEASHGNKAPGYTPAASSNTPAKHR